MGEAKGNANKREPPRTTFTHGDRVVLYCVDVIASQNKNILYFVSVAALGGEDAHVVHASAVRPLATCQKKTRANKRTRVYSALLQTV